MEPQAIIDVGEFDHSKVDLTKPANTVEEYIKQVIVTRESCPEVVVAENIDRSKFKKPISLVPIDESISATCEFMPSKEWSQLKVSSDCIDLNSLYRQTTSQSCEQRLRTNVRRILLQPFK
jgi:hypothetical protein